MFGYNLIWRLFIVSGEHYLFNITNLEYNPTYENYAYEMLIFAWHSVVSSDRSQAHELGIVLVCFGWTFYVT